MGSMSADNPFSCGGRLLTGICGLNIKRVTDNCFYKCVYHVMSFYCIFTVVFLSCPLRFLIDKTSNMFN